MNDGQTYTLEELEKEIREINPRIDVENFIKIIKENKEKQVV